jgi:hypothetical protein
MASRPSSAVSAVTTVLAHLEELHQRLAHGRVVFDDEDDGRWFGGHSRFSGEQM